MKKTIVLLAVIATVAVACKKDRDCSCKTYTTYNGAGATSVDQTITMKKVSGGTARKACIHTKQTYTVAAGGSSVITVDQDINCELK